MLRQVGRAQLLDLSNTITYIIIKLKIIHLTQQALLKIDSFGFLRNKT